MWGWGVTDDFFDSQKVTRNDLCCVFVVVVDFQGSSFVFCQVLLDWQLSNFAWQ